MGHPFEFKIKYYSCTLLFLIIIFSSPDLSAFYSTQDLKSEKDSLFKEVYKNNSDTVRFVMLAGFFWKYANNDLERVKYAGERAFKEIENSSNIKDLSDGYDIKGFILRDEENYDSAFFYFEKALESSMTIGYKSRIAWSYYHLGELYYLFGNFSSALDYMRSAMRYFIRLNYYNDAATSIYYISDMYDRMGIPDSAILYNNKRLDLYINRSDTIGEIVGNLAISTFYKNHSDSKKSLEYLNTALRKAESMNNPHTLTKVYFSIGDFFAEQKKNYSIANDYYIRVLEFAEKNHIKILEAQLLNQIGNIYLLEGNDSLALAFNLRSLAVAKEVKHRHTISNAYNSLGLVYKKLGDYQSALNCFNTCYRIGCNKCPEIAFHKTLIETGDIYFTLNNLEQSLNWYRKSLILAEKFHSKKDIGVSNLKIGNCYQKLNRKTAEIYFLRSLNTANETGDKLLIKCIEDTLSAFYASGNNYSSAYQYKQLSMQLSDSLNEISRQTDMTELEMRFEVEKIRKENEARQAISAEEIKRQKLLKNYFILFSVLFIGLGTAIYAGYMRKRKDNRLLSDQKSEIEDKNMEIRTQVEKITLQKNEIERISNELHESDEMKLRFFSNVSHEFRTPLTLILNPAENLLKTTSGNEETKKQVESIYQNAQKLNDLTNQIMDLQKLDAGKLQLYTEKADIIEYCLGITSSFESLCNKKNLIIRFSSGYKSVITSFDKDKTGKILINIISNALKFSYENSVIDVRIEITGNQFQLVIKDSGIGIPPGEIDNVFKRYYQVPSDNKLTGNGTGIGLAYVKELVRFMNGKVSIESVLNRGTKVNITIPFNDCLIQDVSQFSIEIPETKKRSETGRFDTEEFVKENNNENTVLLVEDNDELRAFISDLLKNEFNVRSAKDGKEGLRSAFHHIPDIIISDVMMPGIDGFELCTIIKKDERTSHIPIILLTARDDSQSSLDGYTSGADDYIIKPFDNEHLKLKVKNIIATREAARNQFDFKSILSSDCLKIGKTDKEFMRKCLAVIETNIDNSAFSVDNLAEALAFSSRNFYRKIKALTNQTPAELIRIYRLNYARQLIQNSNLKIFEISLAVGYEDTNKFRQAFKKQFGLSPSESIKSIID